MKVKKILFCTVILYALCGVIYFYFGNQVQLEFSSDWVRGVWVILHLFIPLILGVVFGWALPEQYQENKFLGCAVPLFIIIFLFHNFVWTFIIFWTRGGYEDMKISYPDLNNTKHKIITQYKDEGAMGGHKRRIEVYELTSFLWYVYGIEYFFQDE